MPRRKEGGFETGISVSTSEKHFPDCRLEALRKKLLNESRKRKAREVELHQAACTLVASCISELSDTGMGLQEFQTVLEANGLTPRNKESSDQTNERALGIVFLKNGKNAAEAAELAIRSLPGVSDFSEKQIMQGISQLMPLLRKKFNIRMGHRS